MSATPKYGSMTFVGARSGKSYTRDTYRSDVANALINWDAGSGASATSPQHWTPPEDVILIDAALVTGAADTFKLQLTRNGVPVGDVLRYGAHTDSVATRPRLSIGFRRGTEIGAIQLGGG